MMPIFHRKMMTMPPYTARSRMCCRFFRLPSLVLVNPRVKLVTNEHSQTCPHGSSPVKNVTAFVNELSNCTNFSSHGNDDEK